MNQITVIMVQTQLKYTTSDTTTAVINCYSVNRYKPLQNRLLQKPLQTVTDSYKQLQTNYSANRYKQLQIVTNSYKSFTP